MTGSDARRALAVMRYGRAATGSVDRHGEVVSERPTFSECKLTHLFHAATDKGTCRSPE